MDLLDFEPVGGLDGRLCNPGGGGGLEVTFGTALGGGAVGGALDDGANGLEPGGGGGGCLTPGGGGGIFFGAGGPECTPLPFIGTLPPFLSFLGGGGGLLLILY